MSVEHLMVLQPDGALRVELPFTICGEPLRLFVAVQDDSADLTDRTDTLFAMFRHCVTPLPGDVEAVLAPYGVQLTRDGELVTQAGRDNLFQAIQSMTGAMLALAARYGR